MGEDSKARLTRLNERKTSNEEGYILIVVGWATGREVLGAQISYDGREIARDGREIAWELTHH